jgi:AAA domain
MSTLPPAQSVIAVDLTAKRNQVREEASVSPSINGKEVHLSAASEAKPSKPVEPNKARFHLTRFPDIAITEGVAYLVKDLIPAMGLVVVWGPPKCGKSFWMFDLSMHIALGQEYRGSRVQQGSVVYFALEGGKGFTHRVEAFRRRHKVEDAPFYLITDRTDLVNDHKQLIDEIRAQLREPRPALVVIDTLNRSLAGSENNDKDMAAYILVADEICRVFGCTVAIIHHCGVSGDRPRGHTSLTGAADAQLAVKRDDVGIITVNVEWLKDGQEGAEIVSLLKQVELGPDIYGDPITSCVVVADDPMARILATSSGQIVRPAVAKLKPKAKLGLEQLRACIAEAGREAPVSTNIPAGAKGVTLDEWRERLGKTAVINVKGNYREEFKRIREQLQNAKLIGVWEDFVWLA